MKPTVSVMITSRSRGKRRRRLVGSRVAKSRSSAATCGMGQGVEQGGFAGVGVADDGEDGQLLAPPGLAPHPSFAPAPCPGSSWSRCSRSRRRRRSISSLDSPGPRPPMPPMRRDRASPRPTRRGSRYFTWAISTWSLPSRLRARWAKRSRMSWVRSMTLSSVKSVMDRTWEGLSSASKTNRSAPCLQGLDHQLREPALAHEEAGVEAGRCWMMVSATVRPADRASSASSVHGVLRRGPAALR